MQFGRSVENRVSPCVGTVDRAISDKLVTGLIQMVKRIPSIDFRETRTLLPDEVFLLSNGPRPGPTDLVSEDVWNGIMHLPDDVALTTSNHHGSQLAQLYTLWGDWLEAIGEKEDELFSAMLDAADCLKCSTFDSLHGYYRSALSNLRGALELVVIGTLGNLSSSDSDYVRWTKRNTGSFKFNDCLRKLRRHMSKQPAKALIVKPDAWLDTFYEKLCAFTHSRPDSSDGAMWRSNGPIYVNAAFDMSFTLQVSTYAACYLLAKLGRTQLALPNSSRFLFETRQLLFHDDMASAYHALFVVSQKPTPTDSYTD